MAFLYSSWSCITMPYCNMATPAVQHSNDTRFLFLLLVAFCCNPGIVRLSEARWQWLYQQLYLTGCKGKWWRRHVQHVGKGRDYKNKTGLLYHLRPNFEPSQAKSSHSELDYQSNHLILSIKERAGVIKTILKQSASLDLGGETGSGREAWSKIMRSSHFSCLIPKVNLPSLVIISRCSSQAKVMYGIL